MSARWDGGEPKPLAIRALTAAMTLAIIILIGLTITAVDARGPDDRCLACATPRPTPIVVGITPAPTLPPLPDTDTE